MVDRKAVADQLERVLRAAPVAPGDKGMAEQHIIDESIADVAAARRYRRRGG